MSDEIIKEDNEKIDFRNRFEKNRVYNSFKNKSITSESFNDSIYIIKVNTERAVIEYVSRFRKFIEARITLDYHDYILDLSNVMFMDSTFLGMIVSIHKELSTQNKLLHLVINKQTITILSQFGQLNKIFSTYETVDEAIEALTK